MSRYSRIFLRQPSNKFTDSWIESPSSMNASQHQRTPSQGYSYYPSTSSPQPPLTGATSPSRSPPPHPYTLGATRSPVAESFIKEEMAVKRDPAVNGAHRRKDDSEKQSSVQEVGLQEVLPPPRTSHRVSIAATSALPERLRLGLGSIFLLYLPLPPLLSMIYMVSGHAILRHARASPASIYNAPITASLEAGATGGIIIAIPLAIIFYLLLLFPTRPSNAPDDFFEDDTSSTGAKQRWMYNAGVCGCALFAICIGGPSGPLGVVCLSHGELEAFVGAGKILSPSSAAAAGFIGGGVIGLGVITLCAFWCAARMLYMRIQS